MRVGFPGLIFNNEEYGFNPFTAKGFPFDETAVKALIGT